MPTLNEYSNKYGYFIRAYPSGANRPITYQIRPKGYSIIESFGLSDTDEISWDTIRTLKSIGLIYTNESGTIGVDEFEPDPDQLEKTHLSEKEAYRLVNVIREYANVTPEDIHEICSNLGIDPPDVQEIEISISLTPEQKETMGKLTDIRGDLGLNSNQMAVLVKSMDAIGEFQDDFDLTEEQIGLLGVQIASELTSPQLN